MPISSPTRSTASQSPGGRWMTNPRSRCTGPPWSTGIRAACRRGRLDAHVVEDRGEPDVERPVDDRCPSPLHRCGRTSGSPSDEVRIGEARHRDENWLVRSIGRHYRRARPPRQRIDLPPEPMPAMESCLRTLPGSVRRTSWERGRPARSGPKVRGRRPALSGSRTRFRSLRPPLIRSPPRTRPPAPRHGIRSSRSSRRRRHGSSRRTGRKRRCAPTARPHPSRRGSRCIRQDCGA